MYDEDGQNVGESEDFADLGNATSDGELVTYLNFYVNKCIVNEIIDPATYNGKIQLEIYFIPGIGYTASL